jgi:hypothetical protein
MTTLPISGQQQQPQQQYSAGHSIVSATPSITGGNIEEQLSSLGKKTFRARLSSTGQSITGLGLINNDYDNRSSIIPGRSTTMYINDKTRYIFLGQDTSKISSSVYKTFPLVRDSDFFRPKLLVESTNNNDSESIDQITVLYMRGVTC